MRGMTIQFANNIDWNDEVNEVNVDMPSFPDRDHVVGKVVAVVAANGIVAYFVKCNDLLVNCDVPACNAELSNVVTSQSASHGLLRMVPACEALEELFMLLNHFGCRCFRLKCLPSFLNSDHP